MDVGKAEYVDNPVIGTMSKKQADELGMGYNLNFEPYASKYDNKLVVDNDANGDVIGILPSARRRNSNHSDMEKQDKDHMDLKFEF